VKEKDLRKLGVPRGEAMRAAVKAVAAARVAGLDKATVWTRVKGVLAAPASFAGDEVFGALARIVEGAPRPAPLAHRDRPAAYRTWGSGHEPTAVQQMDNACSLPVSVAGALMADAHQGYGLPIGGVLATRNAVIPYAVGVDIACRMKLSVLDLPPVTLDSDPDRLIRALERETRFGIGAEFSERRHDDVMDDDWSFSPVVRRFRDKAWAQLGTSGSGNHFVEYGLLTLERPELGLPAGVYLALLSHSGSRGTGAEVASFYSRLARDLHPELPRELHHLAWLDLGSEPGQQYWRAMQLMGRYAAANHRLIHRNVTRHLGVEVLADVENHHNFAWEEEHFGERLIVHRKGATPASRGAIGVIPGSMGTPGYVVRGLGNEASLSSAAHGAGRRMSRTAAKQQFTWADIERFLARSGVRLLSAGLDEAPMAYKDIEQVMAAQEDLVERIARFDPKLVKMARSGERPED
jgi:tRNA-splicing ligase RtcB (3'-phosphate/5'-hydroxy nucleic acid ligase)